MPSSILVVEDHPDVRNVLIEALTEAGGYAAYGACDVGSARTLIETFFPGPDLILLDTWLPDGNGIEFCASLRLQGIYLPIIVLSGLASRDAIERAFEAGADDYLVKPISVSILLEHVAAQLRHGGPKRDRRVVPRERATCLTIR